MRRYVMNVHVGCILFSVDLARRAKWLRVFVVLSTQSVRDYLTAVYMFSNGLKIESRTLWRALQINDKRPYSYRAYSYRAIELYSYRAYSYRAL